MQYEYYFKRGSISNCPCSCKYMVHYACVQLPLLTSIFCPEKDILQANNLIKCSLQFTSASKNLIF